VKWREEEKERCPGKKKEGREKKKGLWRLYDSRSKKGRREKEMSGGERRGGMESWMN